MFSPDGKLAKTMNMIFDILMIGVLWLICSLPLVTLVASTTAAYYAMAKVVRFKAGYMFREFLHGFRMNLKASILPGLINVIVAVILVVDVWYLWNNRSKLNDAMWVVLVGISFLYLACVLYFCPFLSRFTKKNSQLFKMSAYAAFRFLPLTVGILIIVAFTLAGAYLMPWLVVILPGFMIYLSTYPMEYVMRRFMKKPEPGSPEEHAWYWGKTAEEEELEEEEGLSEADRAAEEEKIIRKKAGEKKSLLWSDKHRRNR